MCECDETNCEPCPDTLLPPDEYHLSVSGMEGFGFFGMSAGGHVILVQLQDGACDLRVPADLVVELIG